MLGMATIALAIYCVLNLQEASSFQSESGSRASSVNGHSQAGQEADQATPRSLRPGTVPRLDLSPAKALHAASLEHPSYDEEELLAPRDTHPQPPDHMPSIDDLSGPEDSDAHSQVADADAEPALDDPSAEGTSLADIYDGETADQDDGQELQHQLPEAGPSFDDLSGPESLHPSQAGGSDEEMESHNAEEGTWDSFSNSAWSDRHAGAEADQPALPMIQHAAANSVQQMQSTHNDAVKADASLSTAVSGRLIPQGITANLPDQASPTSHVSVSAEPSYTASVSHGAVPALPNEASSVSTASSVPEELDQAMHYLISQEPSASSEHLSESAVNAHLTGVPSKQASDPDSGHLLPVVTQSHIAESQTPAVVAQTAAVVAQTAAVVAQPHAAVAQVPASVAQVPVAVAQPQAMVATPAAVEARMVPVATVAAQHEQHLAPGLLALAEAALTDASADLRADTTLAAAQTQTQMQQRPITGRQPRQTGSPVAAGTSVFTPAGQTCLVC